MEHPNDFIELLRQIMSRECKTLFSKEVIIQTAHEMEVLEPVGDRHVAWLNCGLIKTQ